MRIAVALYRRGQITAEQLADSICAQSASKKTIGQIALENRMLSVRDTMRILAQQADTPLIPFGEIACSLGLLKREEVTFLLGEQERSLTPLSSVLIKLGYISEEQRDREMERFSKPPQPAHDAAADKRAISNYTSTIVA